MSGNRTRIDRILDYNYAKWFGLKGQLVIATMVVVYLIVNFFAGISTVTLDPLTCELAWSDKVYTFVHKENIRANTKREINRLIAKKLKAQQRIRAGKSPYPSKQTGNVVSTRKINRDKFFWRSFAKTLVKEQKLLSECSARLPRYQF